MRHRIRTANVSAAETAKRKRKGSKHGPGPRRGRGGKLPTPAEILRRQGSRKIRKLESGELLVQAIDIGPPAPLPRTARQWEKLLRLIPGFDPFRDSEECYFDRQEASRKINWIEVNLRHFKGQAAGKPFHLQAWQRSTVANLFGWKRIADGTRRFRYLFLVAGRKNGKTPLAAALVLLILFDDGEAGAEIYSAGLDYKQASKTFEYAYGFLVQNQELLSKCTCQTGQVKSMKLGAFTGFSFYRPIAGNPEEGYSYNTHAVVIDELFTQKDSRLVDSLESSTANRDQPLVIYITTADFERQSICNMKHDYARSIRDQGGDPEFLPILFEANPDDPIDKRSTWLKANPNLGVSVQEDYIRKKAKLAAHDEAYKATFQRLHLCVRTAARQGMIPPADWKICGKRKFSEDDLIGRECWGGLDLAATTHSNALALLFPEGLGFLCLFRFWLPARTIAEWDERGQARYRVWREKGYLIETPGATTDYDWIRRDLNALGNLYLIRELAVDRLFQGQQLCTDLSDDGFDLVAFGQGFLSMAAPTKRFRELVLEGRLWHGSHPVLNWHAANTSALIDPAGNMKPDRHLAHLPNDGIVSAIMALGRAMLEPGDLDGPTVRAL